MSKLDDLLATQQQLLNAIEQVYTNFKKDGSDRKTPDYIRRRLDTLDKYYQDYQSNHLSLLDLEHARSHSYFTSNQFDIFKERCEYIRAAIFNYQSKDDRPSTPVLKPATLLTPGFSQQPTQALSTQSLGINSKTDEMLRKQSSNFKALEHTFSTINLDLITEKWEFDHLLRTIQTRWSVIDTLHWELDSELGGRNQEYETAFFKYESKYNEVIKSVNRKLWSVSHREKSTPNIEIPTFSGSYHQWSSFKDLFTETIHSNPSISSAQKMQFLKTKVKGEAERLIQHLPITSDNYSISWDILNHRYNNKRLILNSHIDILLNIPCSNQLSYQHIKRIHDTTLETLNAIKNLGVEVGSWDPLLVYLLSQKLDTETYADYLGSVQKPRDLPNLQEFLSFLENKFTTLESSRKKSDGPIKSFNNHSPSRKYQNHNFVNKSSFSTNSREMSQSSTNKVSNSSKYYKCAVCKSNDHGIFYCQIFLNMSPYQKHNTIRKLSICENCLYSHNNKPCISEKRCRECNGKHNTILHEAFTQHRQPNNSASPKNSNNGNSHISQQLRTNTNSHVSLQCDEPEIQVLLATAILQIQKRDGTRIHLRALIDQGSQASIITSHAAQLLDLPLRKCSGVISGVGAKNSNCKGITTINCKSIHSDFEFETDVVIMKNLINQLPSNTFKKPSWTYLNYIALADPEFHVSKPIDLLLGADVYALILLEGICRESLNTPIAQNTRLGWILTGNAKTLQCNVILNNLEDIQRFWEIEDISNNSTESLENQQCMEYYRSTTKRCEDGHYQVRLPMKSDFAEKLGKSKSKAIAQLLSLENKFHKHEILEKQYKSFMNEYHALGHMIPSTSNSSTECFSAHHAIRYQTLNPKFRVVFNTSSKTSSGHSLNDVMECGPNLQQDLQSLILKWRVYKFAFTSDIQKMFRQIWMHPDDQNLQKIVWRNSTSQPIKEYQLTTVVYGTKAAPFLAMMTLKQLASDERNNFSRQAIEALESSMYMDDMLYGTHLEASCKPLKEELISLLKAGGFNLTKWKANTPVMLDDTLEKQEEFNFKNDQQCKTLGLFWNPKEDTFTFQSRFDTSETSITKRKLLSEISKQYDPNGWLSPLTTKLKIIFQQVWKCDLQWDDEIPNNIYDEWKKIRDDIHNINLIKLPRWLYTGENDSLELHGFCDASEKAYACVIYSRVRRNGETSISLLVGKTRLVPTNKSVSLPRLELSGALLLSRLMKKVKQCLNNHTIQTYGWVDSMVVLGWVKGNPTRWKTFVANRVSEITQIMPAECWQYIKSEENPADCASRGLTASQLKNHTLWWQGPCWLLSFINNQQQIREYTTDLEVKNKKQVNVVAQQADDNIIFSLLTKSSTFNKAVRVVAWILRFKNIKNKKRNKYLSLAELKQAKLTIIKSIQQLSFYQEISDLRGEKSINSKSKLCELQPFLDEDGLIRVGGRLRHANLDPDMQHPIIIPNNSRLSELLIDQAHELTFHGGARLTSAYLRKKYWIISGNRATKKRLRRCVICRRHNPSKQHQMMGDLPGARSKPSRPFYHTSVDYTGHLYIKANVGRGIKTIKGYVAVFTCMATKAVHLEVVSDLTSSAFLAALRRMSARRGTPRHIYCDNGTNFLGADKALQQEYQELLSIFGDEFHSEIAKLGITFHFTAPSWPSSNGLCEAAVKSLKHHLKRVIGEHRLTFEEITTLCSQIEACLNSRPLCPMTEDSDDLNYLTPSHFLSSGPVLSVYDTEKDLRTRWHLTQKIFRDIWKRWQSEYLTTLSKRSKWRTPQPNIALDDIVIIQDANLPPGKWALGRVVDLHPGSDGYVRVVTLKTKNGYLKRPVVKLSILPVHPEEDNKSSPSAEESTEPKPKSAGKIKCNFVTTATTILLFFMTLISNSSCSYNTVPFQNYQSLFFDKLSNMELVRDHWKLVVYYDLSPYWQGTEASTKYLDYLENTCSKLIQSQCSNIMLQLNHSHSELVYHNNMMREQHFYSGTRQRRGLLNVVGNLANTLFGVLDSDFAEKYEKDIELIKENQNHLGLLWKNQTSIVEAELNLIKRTETIMNKQHKAIHKQLSELETSLDTLKSATQNSSYIIDFTLSSIIANNLLNTLRNIQDDILDTITDVYHGRLNLHLLTPTQLQQELNIISSQLAKDLSLPGDSANLSNIYKLLSVKTRISESYLIFEISIPLISRDLYEIYHIIPIPIQSNNSMLSILPISEYIAINIHKEAFISISDQELSVCSQQSAVTMLCYLQKPIYRMKNDQDLCLKDNSSTCLSNSKQCEDIFKATNKPNIYFYFCCNTCNIKLICADHITAIQLTHAGLMTLGQGCLIRSADFSLYSHRKIESTINIKSQLDIPEMAPINHVINLTISHPHITDMDEINDKQVDEIKDRINIMKQNEPILERVSYHDVHHYVAIYVIVGAALVVGAALAWRRGRRARPARRGSRGPATDHDQRTDVKQCTESIELRDVKCQCGESNQISESVKFDSSARNQKQNRGTSPNLESVFTINDSRL